MRIGLGAALADTARRVWESGQAAIHRGIERISTGLRINRAADDAAGLAISERMQGRRFGLEQATRNTQDAISLTQTAEGTLAQHHAVLQRMRTIAVQSANGIYSADQRSALQTELNQLITEVDASSQNANFNGRNLLDGSFLDARFQAGANGGDTVSLSIARFDSVGLRLRALGASLVDPRSGFGSVVGGTSTTTATAPVMAPTTDPATIIDTTVTTDTTTPTTPETTTTETTAPTTGPGSGKGQGVHNGNGNGIIKNGNGGGKGGGGGAATAPAPTPPTAPGSTAPATPVAPAAPGGWALSVMDVESAQNAIGILDDAIWLVSRGRAELGAAENSFGHRLRSMSVEMANLDAAYSRIRDADLAYEMSRLVRHQISSQAAASMMAQANAQEQNAARLLLR
ncbi:MAG: flagellin [Dermatophilus congolensis]|nr:flagellin [Dermatophilus congolensis]